MAQNNSRKNLLKDTLPLHYLSKTGNHAELNDYFESNKDEAIKQLNKFDVKGRTVLHYSSLAVNLSDGEICAQAIIRFYNQQADSENMALGRRRQTRNMRRQQWKGKNVSQTTINFINHKDVDHETALSLAAKAENEKIVELLLLNSADVLSTNLKNERCLELIYQYTPSAIKALLDKSISFEHGVDEERFLLTERSYYMDFTSVIGFPDDGAGNQQRSPETLCLQLVNNKRTANRKVILTHPLVRHFLSMKMEKIQWVSWSTLAVFMFWIVLYFWHAVDIYYTCCEIADDIYGPLGLITSNAINGTSLPLYCSDYPFNSASIKHPNVKTLNWTLEMEDIVYGEVTTCFKEKDSLARGIPLVILSFLLLVVSFFQILALKMDYFKLKNLILLLFHLGLLITAFPTEAAFKFQFQVAAFAIVAGLVVALELVNKHIYWGIYIRVLMKLIKRFLAIMPLFFVIMLAFSVSMRMVYPSLTPSLEEFRNAMMEVFASIANGKVEWIEGHKYQGGVDAHFKATGLILFIVFYVTMVLLLFRILIGFVVADTKKIQEAEELNEISNDLQEIFLIESLLHSRIFQSIGFLKNLGSKFILFPKFDDLELWLTESKIERELRPKMRALATKNPVKIRETHTTIGQRRATAKKANNVKINLGSGGGESAL